MSTRSRIAVANEDGTYTSIYCHFDGYIGGVGRRLLENFTTRQVAEEMMSLGDASSIGEGLSKCEFYSRDRGEDQEETKASTSKSLDELRHVCSESGGEFLYVWHDDRWFVELGRSRGLIPLAAAMEDEVSEDDNI